MNTDKAWEYFGEKDPYYGVLTDRRFSLDAINDTSRQEFFESGQLYVDRLMQKVGDLYPTFVKTTMCDFGCGVGRLTLPFADWFDNVTGVDISAAMLNECKRAADEFGTKNIRLVLSDTGLSQLNGSLSLVHSFITFQHIPVARGLELMKSLLQRLAIGGIAAIHVVHSNNGKLFLQFLKRLPIIWHCSNVLRKRPLFEPPMEMNAYPLSSVLQIFKDSGIEQVTLDLTNHGHAGCMLIGQKTRAT